MKADNPEDAIPEFLGVPALEEEKGDWYVADLVVSLPRLATAPPQSSPARFMAQLQSQMTSDSHTASPTKTEKNRWLTDLSL